MRRIIMDSLIAAFLAACYTIGFVNAVRKGWTR